jgi:hypothetical protein
MFIGFEEIRLITEYNIVGNLLLECNNLGSWVYLSVRKMF